MALDWYFPRLELAKSAAHRPEPGEPSNELSRINFWSDRLAGLAGEKTILLMLDEVQELAIHPEGSAGCHRAVAR